MDFTELRKNIKKDFSGLKKIKLAITGDWATQMLAQAIRGYGYTLGFDIEIYEAPYAQMEGELLDKCSELYSFHPGYILIFPCIESFQERFYKLPGEEREEAADKEVERLESLVHHARTHSDARVMIANYCELDDGVYGNYAGMFQQSLLYTSRTLNQSLADMASCRQINLIDINSLQSQIGRASMHDERLYYLSKTVFSMEGLVHVAMRACAAISALEGKIKKCLVTDLDNTLWGGIIGDDGLEGIQVGDLGSGKAFCDLQAYLKELSKRGIAIAVCSKNSEEAAKEPFEKHPDMVLKLDDIAVFAANWEDKATNIKRIKDTLNIGMDSIVFIDDNPFERNLIRNLLPEATVPELPKSPAQYLNYLKSLNLFETVKVSSEDRERSRQYREEAKRIGVKENASDIGAYLESLEMEAAVKPFDSFSIPRAAQLTQRSNQFNLRTKRYTEHELAAVAESEQYITMAVSAKDKFGDYGIIAIIILEDKGSQTLFIDTLLMSCRVLKRTVEEFVFNEIVKTARARGVTAIWGEYLPTKKNGMVAGLLENYGFIKESQEEGGKTSWILHVDQYIARKTYVRLAEGV